MTHSKFKKVFFDPGYLPVDEVGKLLRNYPSLKLCQVPDDYEAV